jgi:outer membrane protein assembly factor BamB
MTCVTLAGLLTAVCIGQQYVPDSNDFLSDPALRAADLQRYWEAEIPLRAGDSPVSAALVDETLYVISSQGTVAAFHAGTGLPLWTYPVRGTSKVLPPAHLTTAEGPGAVAIASDRRVTVLDRTTGKALAEFGVEFPAGSPAVGDDKMLYLGSADGHMYALRWDYVREDPIYGRPVHVWRAATKGPIRSQPVFDGWNLLYASEGGDIYSCVAYKGVKNWSRDTLGPIFGSLVLDQNTFYAASADRSLYRLDAKNGDQLWRLRLPMPLDEGPLLAGRLLFQPIPGPEGGISAVDADTGGLLWHHADARSFVARDGDVVYLLKNDGEHLLAVDAGTGQPKRSVAIYGTKIVVPNPISDAIYLVSSTNRAACVRPARVPYLTLKDLAAVRARLHKGTESEETEEPAPLDQANDRAPAEDPLRSRSNVSPMVGG